MSRLRDGNTSRSRGKVKGRQIFDHNTGFELDAEGVRKARIEETEHTLRLGVWKVTDINEATATTEQNPISV